MKINLPDDVQKIIKTLNDNGHAAYAVGGCVRDSILGIIPNDWDITTSAKPEETKALFEKTFDTGIEHGTVTVLLNHTGYEVTTYRVDGRYDDGRHPNSVSFTSSLEEDLKRRDFTINAMAYNDDEGLVDIFGGIEDLNNKVVRAVGNPKDRFTEDALRMLRALRFAAQLGFIIEPDTRAAISQLAPTIKKVSAERIQVEIVKLIISDNPGMIRDVYETGLTSIFLPEFDDMMKTNQNCIHHMYTVGEHTIEALKNIPGDRILRLTMLLHDVAKPVCKVTDDKGVDHFHGHPVKGQEMAKEILRRLKFDNDTIDKVSRLVRYHDERPVISERAIRRTIVKMGLDCYPDIFAVKRADTLAQSDYQREEKLKAIDEFEKIYHQILEKSQCLTMKELKVNGRDLIEMGLGQGKLIGQVLSALFEEVVEEPSNNDREYLLARAQEIISDKNAI